jgi:hypothetical protein
VAFDHPVYKDCAGLTGTQITIHDRVSLATKPGTTLTTFKRKWEETLAESEREKEKQWEQCQGNPFLALARWLDAHRHADIAWLLAEMKELGTPDKSLIDLIRSQGKESDEDEYGDREKASRLTGTGFRLVKDLLKQLQEQEGDRNNWPLGIRMLADRLADIATQKEEGQ